MIEFEQPSVRSEQVGVTARLLKVDPQAIELRVDATMIQFDVYAELVASNSNALRRIHFFYNVTFSDGPTGDDGFEMVGNIVWPDESVIFSDSGLVVTQPIDIVLHEVNFTEDDFKAAWAIHNSEFVTFADYAIDFILDFLSINTVTFSDISIAWAGVHHADDAVTVDESLFIIGGNNALVSLRESVNISETLIGANSFAFGDAVTLFEFWDTGLAFPLILEVVTWTDVLVVSEVAATDARPGAFIPGSALLGSPT